MADEALVTTEAGMPETTVKKTVTMRRSIAEQIEERAGGDRFSTFIDAAAEHWLAPLKAQEIAEDHERRHGRLPEDVVEEARRAWHGEEQRKPNPHAE